MADRSSLQSRTIDALRFPCAILVVLVHTFRAHPGSTGFPYAPFEALEIALSQGISRIAVPVFFLISGYLFFSRLDPWDWHVYGDKIRNRARTLLVPYLLWVTLAILWMVVLNLIRHYLFGWGLSISENLSSNGWGLMYWNCARNYQYTELQNILGWTMPSAFPYDYPLWYLRDLIVLCLLAPVIHWSLLKTKGWVLALLYPLYLLNIWIPLEGLSAEGFLFFGLGAFLRMNGKDMTAVFGRFKIASYILFPLAIAFCVLTYGNAVSWEYARRLLTLPGTVAAFNLCAALLQKGWLKENRFLAECSFPVFAGHAIGLTVFMDLLVNKLIPGTGDAVLFLKYLLRPTFIVLIILVVYYLAKRFIPKTTALFTGGRS